MLYRQPRRTLAIITHGQDQPCTRDEVGFGNPISASTTLLCIVFASTSPLDAKRELLPPRPSIPPQEATVMRLSKRQEEIIERVAEGYSGKVVARLLGISPETVSPTFTHNRSNGLQECRFEAISAICEHRVDRHRAGH